MRTSLGSLLVGLATKVGLMMNLLGDEVPFAATIRAAAPPSSTAPRGTALCCAPLAVIADAFFTYKQHIWNNYEAALQQRRCCRRLAGGGGVGGRSAHGRRPQDVRARRARQDVHGSHRLRARHAAAHLGQVQRAGRKPAWHFRQPHSCGYCSRGWLTRTAYSFFCVFILIHKCPQTNWYESFDLGPGFRTIIMAGSASMKSLQHWRT